MLFDIITTFPEMFPGIIQQSIVKRAQDKGLVTIRTHDLRNFSLDKHRKVDDSPYGGGPGMVLKAEPLFRAINAVTQENPKAKRIYLTPDGKLFSQQMAQDLAQESHLVLVCGHYEGIDQRVRDTLIDEEISIGDYVLTCGELPALVLLDAVVRLIPGVLGSEESLQIESFSDYLLDYPQYTRPRVFEGREIPEVLISGHHEKIRKWRRRQSLVRTRHRRPDLFEKVAIDCRGYQAIEGFLTLERSLISIGLLHFPVYNKNKEVVITSITTSSLHDISRTARTFGVESFYIITPIVAHKQLVDRLVKHWQVGYGAQYNPTRRDALCNVMVVNNLGECLQDLKEKHQKNPVTIATCARSHKNNISYARSA